MSFSASMAIAATYDDPQVTVLTRIGSGSQPDLAKLYDTTSPLVFALVVRMIGDRMAAEAVLLDVYVQVWKQAAHYDPHSELPLPWLTRLARQQALDYLQTNGYPRAQMASPVSRDAKQHVSAVLGALSAEQLQAIEMAYFDGFNYHQMADELGRSPSTIKHHIGAAMKCMRQNLLAP